MFSESNPVLPRLSERRNDLAGLIETLLHSGPGSAAVRTHPTWAESAICAREHGIDPDPGRVYLPIRNRAAQTSETSAGYLIGADNPGDSFFGALVGASIAARLGAQFVPQHRGNRLLPVVTVAPTTQWLADEHTEIVTNPPHIGSRAATPKHVSALVEFSHQLLRQSSVVALLMRELGRAVAAEVDRVLFNGTGTVGRPLGLLATPGVDTASCASLDHGDTVDMIAAAMTAGAALERPGFAADVEVLKLLMKREIVADTGRMLTDGATLAGKPIAASKTGPAGALVFADWSNVTVPTWGPLELAVDPHFKFNTGGVAIRAILACDVLVAHPAAVSIRTQVS